MSEFPVDQMYTNIGICIHSVLHEAETKLGIKAEAISMDLM